MKHVLRVPMLVLVLAVASSAHASSQRSFRDLIAGLSNREVAIDSPSLPTNVLFTIQEVGKDFFCAKWMGSDKVTWEKAGSVRCYPLKDVRWIALPPPEASKDPPRIELGGQ